MPTLVGAVEGEMPASGRHYHGSAPMA